MLFEDGDSVLGERGEGCVGRACPEHDFDAILVLFSQGPGGLATELELDVIELVRVGEPEVEEAAGSFFWVLDEVGAGNARATGRGAIEIVACGHTLLDGSDGHGVRIAVLAGNWQVCEYQSMPTRNGLKSTTPSGVVEAAQNVDQPKNVGPSPEVEVKTIYARTTGSDSTGNGTLANPYATMVRAIEDVPLVIYSNERYVIDITGITEDLDGYNFPPISAQSDLGSFDVAATGPWSGFYAPLHIEAEPQETHSIPGGEISAQNADANTGMYTIVTTNSYTPDELKGKLIVGSGVFEWAIVAGNTATDIEHCGTSAFTAPVKLYDAGATIINTDDTSYNAPIRIVNALMSYSFGGINFEHDSGSTYRTSMSGYDVHELIFSACWFEGLNIDMDGALEPFYCYFRNKIFSGQSTSSVGTCVFDNVRFGQLGSFNPVGEYEAYACYFLGCRGTMLSADGVDDQHPGAHMQLRNCEIRNAIADAVVMLNGALEMHDTNIVDSAGWAVRLRDNATALLYSVKGTGNGGGLKLEKGAQATSDTDTDIDHEVTTFYARTGGDDDNNLGTLASPYATFVRAMEDVPLVQEAGKRYVVDITGITEDVVGFEMPAFQSSSLGLVFDLAGTDITGIQGAVTLYAEPTTEATIASGEISAQNADSNTGMYTVVTTNSYTPDQFKGMFIAGSGAWEWAAIAGNTATDIETTGEVAFTAPITIMSPGATLQNTTSFAPVIRQFTGNMSITGIHFKQTYHAAARSYEAIWGKMFNWMNACWFDGFEHRDGTVAPNYCYFTGRVWSGGPWFGTYHTVFDGAEFVPLRSAVPCGLVAHLNTIFLGCDNVGPSPADEKHAAPGLELDIQKCLIRGSTGAGLLLSGGTVDMASTTIENSTGAALRIIRNATAWLDSVKGSGNTGGGLLVEDGAQVIVNAATDVNTGEAPEVTVGANAAKTWATFRGSGPPYNEVDATVQLARLVQRT